MDFTGTTPAASHRAEVLALYREVRQYAERPLDAINMVIWWVEARHPDAPGRMGQLEVACRLRHGMHPTAHMIGLPRLARICAFSADEDELVMAGRQP